MKTSTNYLPTSYCYDRRCSDEGKICPVDALDCVMYKGIRPIIKYYDPSTGAPFSSAAFSIAQRNAENKLYPATDHAPICITVGGVKVLYVSLDNSVRSNLAGHSLTANNMERLTNICAIVAKINPGIVFFSESCRQSFDGSERANTVKWPTIKRQIAKLTGMIFGVEQTNNFDIGQMSFGVSMFYSPAASNLILAEQGIQLLPVNQSIGFWGTGVVLVTLVTGESILGVHFPLDFRRDGEDNHGYIVTQAVVKLLDTIPNSFAIGDMNTVHGKIENVIGHAIRGTEWTIARDVYSFLPSYYDTIPDHPKVPSVMCGNSPKDITN